MASYSASRRPWESEGGKIFSVVKKAVNHEAMGEMVTPEEKRLCLLDVARMARADRATIDGGIPGSALMEAAGAHVARVVAATVADGPVVVLCGPGNNGGDGFIAARRLKAAGRPVRVALLGPPEALAGDAASAAASWAGPVEPLSEAVLDGAAVVVDALFGAGLSRPLDGAARAVIEAIGERGLPCVAVDVPSGVHGDSGAVLGVAPRCVATATFFRRKPGHLLLPGRALCGAVAVGEIGIAEAVLDILDPTTFENAPGLWRVPAPRAEGHKYDRGHAVVVGGPRMTGAGRLAALAARRIGAGLLTVAAPDAAAADYAIEPGNIVWRLPGDGTLSDLLGDTRRNAVLVGPGGGVGEATTQAALTALGSGRPCVLDADALTSFRADPARLFSAIRGPCVLTPHDGEYGRLFPHVGSRLERARAAAAESGAVVLLKGGDTVIAAPDGRAAITANAPPDLASGGTGDVLAGFILGLLAQGMDAFAAACAGAWVHGACAVRIGPGLIAEDLPQAVGEILADLRG